MSEKPAGRRRKITKQVVQVVETIPEQSVVPYDENLLERARTQWQFGDWLSLAEIDLATLQHHPDRAKLALLAAAGLLQIGNGDTARQLVRRAQDWGCNQRLIARILSAGVHNSLGRAAALGDQHPRAIRHFESAIATSAIGGDSRLLGQARAREQLQQIQMITQHRIGPASGVVTTALVENDESVNAYLFTIKLRLEGSVPIPLGFNTSKKQWLKVQENIIDYQTEKGAPLYLISNQDGNFEKPPQLIQIPVAHDTDYLLSCDIQHIGNNSPVIWIFQYAHGQKIDAQSIPAQGGRVRHGFKTMLETESLAIGIRLAGEGQLNAQDSLFSLEKRSEQELIESLEAKFEKIRRSQQQEIANSMKQIESSIRLQSYLGADIVLPDMHNWPISPDFGVLLINLMEQNAYDGVIEFGSGTSTLIVAKVLEKMARRNATAPAPLLSFDHLDEYGEKTAKLLQQARLTGQAQVVVSPLAPWQDEGGGEYAYYSCDEALQAFKQQLPDTAIRLLVIVDGPPAATGKHARYPALPIVLGVFSGRYVIDFLMDDYLRTDEQEIVARWLDNLDAQKLTHTRTEFNNLEKKACLIEVRPETAGVSE
jgi:hypothetical protein